MTTICIGRETYEALAKGEPVPLGSDLYAIPASSYDNPYVFIDSLRSQRDALVEALTQIIADCDDYVRVNNLYHGNGEPAKWASVEAGRAALAKAKAQEVTT